MIKNYMCDRCDHTLVCKKKDILERFDSESKKYIDVNIEMLTCADFSAAEGSDE